MVYHIHKLIGERIRFRREHLCLSQSQVALAACLTTHDIYRYENALCEIPASVLYTLGQILCVPLSYFFTDIEAASAEPPDALVADQQCLLRDQQLWRLFGHGDVHHLNGRIPVISLVERISGVPELIENLREQLRDPVYPE